jgi:hypothetical protein
MYNCSQNNGRKGIRADGQLCGDFSALRDVSAEVSSMHCCQHGLFSYVV